MARPHALIVGTGPGLSAALARKLAETHDLTLTARNTAKLEEMGRELGARLISFDAADADGAEALFADLPRPLDVAIYNPSARVRGPIAELEPAMVRRAIDVTAFGAFLMGRLAAASMLRNPGPERGTILFTGASAGVKGFAQSAAFAMGKFAQRGLAQSMARELHPKGIHVAWVNIDGAIAKAPDGQFKQLDPEAIADSYMHLIAQPPSAWSTELTVRPMHETF